MYSIEKDTNVVIMTSGLGCSIFLDDILKAFGQIPDDRFTLPGRYKDGTHLEVGA